MEGFLEKTDCSNCPCLNSDYESGSSCNLDYATSLEWTRDKELIYCSTECKLKSIEWAGGKFEPIDRLEVIDLHPNHWGA